MNAPEPVDEIPAGGVEQRGGASPVDYITEDLEQIAQHPVFSTGLGCGDPDCGCAEI